MGQASPKHVAPESMSSWSVANACPILTGSPTRKPPLPPTPATDFPPAPQYRRFWRCRLGRHGCRDRRRRVSGSCHCRAVMAVLQRGPRPPECRRCVGPMLLQEKLVERMCPRRGRGGVGFGCGRRPDRRPLQTPRIPLILNYASTDPAAAVCAPFVVAIFGGGLP